MALPDISLAQFNRIAAGSYNAGQIDFKTDEKGAAELVKVNNHVWTTSKNNVELSPARVLEVKEAFLNALQKGGVGAKDMDKIRERLGLPSEVEMPAGTEQRASLLGKRFTPLTRAQVRSILDEFAKGGLGFTPEALADVSYEDLRASVATRNMSASHAATRDAVNGEAMVKFNARGNAGVSMGVTDALSILSTSRSLAEFDAARSARCTGANAVNERSAQHAALVNSFQTLVAQALKMRPAGVRESGEFQIEGETVKLVKGEDGSLSAIVGKGALATKVALKMDAETFAMRLVGRAVADAETLSGPAAKAVLNAVYDNDLDGGMVASEKQSLTRQFAALIIAQKSGDKLDFDALVRGDYNTGILVELAERALDGEDVGDTREALKAYHEKLRSDNADLPDDIKKMLENVANIPLEKTKDGGLLVRAPIVGDIDKVVAAMPPPAAAPVPKALGDIGGLNGVKDFVADLVFSDDTMVGDVTIDHKGGAMRKMLSSDRNVVALAEIIKNPDILGQVCAPQISGVVKEGFGKMIGVLDDAFRKANGTSLADAAKEADFVSRLAEFLKDADKLSGDDLAKFDNILLTMATKGCENIQTFINGVFQVDKASVNMQGGIVNDPYKDMSADQIKKELTGKTLNQILDAASNSDAPGQVGFFRQVISTYFTSLGKADKRSCFASAMRYAQTFDFPNLKDDALKSAQKFAVNKFTGAILKGTSPLLQKMMQGLPKDIMGDYADALADMKSALAPIPRKIVQAHLMQLINDSKGTIKSIELKSSLGAASVGEAFLCNFTYVENGEETTKEFVVKIMRHDAEKRVKAEAEIFTAAAKKIPGMDKTWEGQLQQYMTEFDFTNEAKNVEAGVGLYDIAGKPDHSLRLIAPNVRSMKLSSLVEPQKNIMVAEVAAGQTVDKYFKQSVEGIRKAASAVFKQDPTTGRIQWQDGPVDPETGKPKKVPVFKADIPAASVSNLQLWLANNYSSLESASSKILQATKAWFHEALLGSGKFHGDTHAGNLMVAAKSITFIDFGNLYTLQSPREDGVDEKAELLRVITGAAFRDKKFVLDGFAKLMSPAGRAALEHNRLKAEAILDAVLDKKKGGFSFNIVYRLQAAVVELQKLGMELPPQINCFIQSLVRLSNTVSEMNTIMNQCKAMLDATNTLVRQPPQRDELDIVGRAFDVYASEDGKKRVNGKPAYITKLGSAEFGGSVKDRAPMFKKGGEYTKKVLDRLRAAKDAPVAEAEKLAKMLTDHLDAEHNDFAITALDPLGEALGTFKEEYAKATTDAERDKAVQQFAEGYSVATANALQSMFNCMQQAATTTLKEPPSFAGAVTSVLFDSADALTAGMGVFEKIAFGAKVLSIGRSELKLSADDLQNTDKIFEAIVKDSGRIGDKDYQIDIGV